MRKFKKSLAFALAAAMIVTAVPVNAAAAPTAKLGTSTLYANGISKYKTTYVSVSKGYTFKTSTKNTKVLTLGKTSGVQAKAAGKTRTGTAKAVVTVKIYKGKKVAATKNLNVTVKPAAYAVSVKVDKKSINLGDTAQASGTMAVAKASGSIRYYSSNTAVATVNATTGKITAKAGGTTKITAVTTISRKTSAAVEVTVVADAPAAKQTGAKTIEINNGVSMKDRAVTVKNGNTEVAIEKDGIKLSSDEKTIIITTQNKISDGEYTIAVADKEMKLNVSAEKVSSIKILNDKAAASTDNAPTKASVGYIVENQFGEDVTKSYPVRISGTDIHVTEISSGEIEFERSGSGAQAYIIDRDVVSVSLVHLDSGVSTQATLTVSKAAVVKDVTFAGVYNADNKAFTEDEEADEFYLLFTVKDQYGKQFKDYDDVKVGKDIFVNIGGGFTNLTVPLVSGTQTAKKIKKDGVEYLGVKLALIAGSDLKLRTGTATVSVYSPGGGVNLSETITVGVGSKVDKITVTYPSDIVSGEDIEFPFVALDANGNAVTKYDSLKDVKINGTAPRGAIGGTSTDYMEWRKDSKGDAKLVLVTAAKTNDVPTTATFQTETFQTTYVQFTIKKAATVKKIAGTKNTLGVVVGVTKEVKLEDIKLEDQHGRTITDKKRVRELLVGKVVNASTASADFAVSSAGITIAANTAYDTVLFEITSTATNSSTGTIKLILDADATTSVNVDVTASTAGKLTGVKATVDSLFADGGSTYATKVKVKGSRGGVEMDVPTTDYRIDVSGTDLQLNAAGDKIYLNAVTDITEFSDSKNREVTQKIQVVLNNGDTIPVEVKISRNTPVISEVTFEDTKFTKAQASVDPVTNMSSIFGQITKIKDSYGIEYKPDTAASDVNLKFNKNTGEIKFAGITNSVIPTLTFSTFDDATKVQYHDGTAMVNGGNGSNKAVILPSANFSGCNVTVRFGTFSQTLSVTKN